MKRDALRRRPAPRGSALVAVLLVVLVLTIVGIGVAFYTSSEDRTSGNADLARVGFYAAEAGLRDAESAVATYAAANGGIVTPLLAVPADPKDAYQPPGGGHAAYLLRLAARSYRNVVLGPQVGIGATRPMYSVFVRNNPEDAGGPNTDTDRRVNVVVVGQAVLVDGAGAAVLDGDGNPTVGITKVLEEQLETNPEGSAAATQKGTNVGGTSSGAK